MVTICTASLIFSNSTFCPHSVFVCFVWIWEQTAIISLHNINWPVFITEPDSVYCAVRTSSVSTTAVIFSFLRSDVAQSVTIPAKVSVNTSPVPVCCSSQIFAHCISLPNRCLSPLFIQIFSFTSNGSSRMVFPYDSLFPFSMLFLLKTPGTNSRGAFWNTHKVTSHNGRGFYGTVIGLFGCIPF